MLEPMDLYNLVTSPIWSQRRKGGVDRRTRGARRWAVLRADLERELGREPTANESVLLDCAADVAIAGEIARTRLTVGGSVDDAIRAASEYRRIRRVLDLEDGNGVAPEPEQSLADLLAEHGKP
jgi:hypothetical protein